MRAEHHVVVKIHQPCPARIVDVIRRAQRRPPGGDVGPGPRQGFRNDTADVALAPPGCFRTIRFYGQIRGLIRGVPKCSKIAWKRRKDEEQRLQRLDEVVKKIPKSKEYITVPEAYALFGISKETLYRLIRKGTIPSVNAGERQTLLSKEELMKLYPLRKKTLTKPKPIAKLYSLEPKDCYTIGGITEKFLVNESTVYLHIRKYSIPTRQIGNFVYVPKKEIDNLCAISCASPLTTSLKWPRLP